MLKAGVGREKAPYDGWPPVRDAVEREGYPRIQPAFKRDLPVKCRICGAAGDNIPRFFYAPGRRAAQITQSAELTRLGLKIGGK